MTKDTEAFDLKAAPIRIGMVRLNVRDLARVSGFYRDALGLSVLDEPDGTVVLGTATTPLLELFGDPALAPRDSRAAGLFHTAFLLPSRSDLARWLAFAAGRRLPLQGASDHIVSEAIYLTDPEGNGIEVYADRPPARWRAPSGEIHMTTEPLDVEDLLGQADGSAWAGFPLEGVIGHVHLQVGDTAEAERFYGDLLGFEVTNRYPGASFFGSGGYHHQLAGNVWNSRRAGPRPERMAGLHSFDLVVSDTSERARMLARAESAGAPFSADDHGRTLRDPWGTGVRITS